MRLIVILTTAAILLLTVQAQGQQCASAELRSQEAYQYGRFETRMQSAQGDGIVSSFFLYNVDLGCNWPAENNEIDIEMTGNRDDSVQFTTHYPGPWYATQIIPTSFNPHADKHDYAFEWEPGVVRWFIDDELVYTQDAGFVDGLMYPMRIIMNLWAVDSPDWAGTWDPSSLPSRSTYDYVRYYAYTPGVGTAGSGNNFTLQWDEQFEDFNAERWEANEFGGFGGNLCEFVSTNLSAEAGELRLDMTEPLQTTFSLVDFSVDVTALNLDASDVIYLNGGFNNWCGSCNPMHDVDGDGIWELTLSLPAGSHEYLFTKNGWSETGGAPPGSSCDFLPCDSYNNYGVNVPYNAGPISTDTYRWGSCEAGGFPDSDDDGIADNLDNCVDDSNPAQRDTDFDGHGNLCDADFDQNCIVNIGDLGRFRLAFFTSDPHADLDGNGVVNVVDLGIMRALFFAVPGPSPAGALCSQ